MAVNVGVVKDEERISSLEGITLAEAMKSIEGPVKIGTENGNAFAWCGTARQYELEERSFNKRLKKKKTTTYENAKANMRKAISDPCTSVSAYLKSALKAAEDDYEKMEISYEGYIEFVKAKIEKIALRPARIAKAREAAEKFIPASERLVKMAYRATTQFDPEGTLILSIEGDENGDAWTVDEYRKMLKEEKHKEEAFEGTIPFDSPEYDEVFGDD